MFMSFLIYSRNIFLVSLLASLIVLISACSSTYYNTMEKVGIHKRDILVDRVENARDSQSDAQEQFKSALDEFSSVLNVKETNLKKAYESLNEEYEGSQDAADEVSQRIDKVESVAIALFKEWKQELALYENPNLKKASEQKLIDTRKRYDGLMETMRNAEQSMKPVLRIFRDNVLVLKHSLNAQAIGALRSEFAGLKSNINRLIIDMNRSIESSDRFIAEMEKQG